MNQIKILEMDTLIKFLDAKVTFDDVYKEPLKKAINDSKQRNYSDSTIEKKVNGIVDLRSEFHLVDKHINNFKGLVYERIEMYAYNRFKNSDNVITTTNPDDTSKSDLVHIIDNGKYSFPRCGADVKYGSPSYVVNEYIKKHLSRPESNGFIDTTGYLEPKDYTEEFGFKKLPASENVKVMKAIEKYGYKPTIPPTLPLKQYEQIFAYYINYLRTGILPSKTETKDLLPIIKNIDSNQYKKVDFYECIPSQIDMSIKDVKELVNEAKSQEDIDYTLNKTPDNSAKSDTKPKSQVTPQQILRYVWDGVKRHPIKTALAIGGTVGTLYLGKKHGGKIVRSLLNSENAKKVANAGTQAVVNDKEVGKKVTEEAIKTVGVKVVEYLVNNASMEKVSAFNETLSAFISQNITLEQTIVAIQRIAEVTGKNPIKYLQMIINFFPGKAEFAVLLRDALKSSI